MQILKVRTVGEWEIAICCTTLDKHPYLFLCLAEQTAADSLDEPTDFCPSPFSIQFQAHFYRVSATRKPGMKKCFLCRQAKCWVWVQHSVDETDDFRAEFGQDQIAQLVKGEIFVLLEHIIVAFTKE